MIINSYVNACTRVKTRTIAQLVALFKRIPVLLWTHMIGANMNQCESTPGQCNLQNQVKLNKGSLCSVSRMYFGAYLNVSGFGTKPIWEQSYIISWISS